MFGNTQNLSLPFSVSLDSRPAGDERLGTPRLALVNTSVNGGMVLVGKSQVRGCSILGRWLWGLNT